MTDIQPYSLRVATGHAFIPATELHAALITWQAYEPWVLTHLMLSGGERGIDYLMTGNDPATVWLGLPLAAAVLQHLGEDMDGTLAAERLDVTQDQLLRGSVQA